MNTANALAQVAALVGDPGRANMLDALLDRRALTATELALTAGVSPATASGHLAKLVQGGLVLPAKQGRHRYFRLASDEVARMLEAILVVAGRPDPSAPPPKPRASPRIDPALREARTCYDHLAGRLAVSLADALVARGALSLKPDSGALTPGGQALFAAFGIEAPGGRRALVRPCLDWSERRPHLAGALGAAFCARCEALGWIARQAGSRAVTITPAGRQGFAERFGVTCTAAGEP